jgi:predicted nucleic acid-binding Zn finger protein
MDKLQQAIQFLKALDISEAKISSRIKNAQKIDILTQDESDECQGEVIGSSGEVYVCSLNHCTCRDWKYAKGNIRVCKHQIALALALIQKTENPECHAFLTMFKKSNQTAKENQVILKFTNEQYQDLEEWAVRMEYPDVHRMCMDIINSWLKNKKADL